jgi:hypothetical protein
MCSKVTDMLGAERRKRTHVAGLRLGRQHCSALGRGAVLEQPLQQERERQEPLPRLHVAVRRHAQRAALEKEGQASVNGQSA